MSPMKVTLHATNIELTDALREYAEKKILGLEKYHDRIIKVSIDIGMESQHHKQGKIFFAEVNLSLPGNKFIRVVKQAEDLYKAIEKVRDHMKVELEKIKGKARNKDKKVLRDIKAYQE